MNNTADDKGCNESSNEHFQHILDARLSRRGLLTGGLAAAAALSFGGMDALLRAVPASAHERRRPLLGFRGIPVSDADTVTVPPGYTAEVLIAWGDPLSHGPAFKQDASNSAADQARQWGMHNDGVVYFPIIGSQRGLLVQNHEYTDDGLLFPDGIASWSQEKTNKCLNAHGVSIIEITKRSGFPWDRRRRRGDWDVVRPSPFARRITGMTPIAIGGPAAGDPKLRTTDDPTGTRVLGTLNNCAMGFTPWGTYLACEENFNGFFQKTMPKNQLENRYGIAPFNSGLRLFTTDPRFNADVEINEPNRFGWVVEIDPFKPNTMPVKRTALGRLKHEGAWVQETKDGKVVVYMGDDERNEYIYRYVSNKPWRKARLLGINPLDDGILYVAKFKSDGTGEWLPLLPSNPALAAAGWSLNDILINTRGAADAVGATMMDRPEWIDTFPESLTAIATLTNNNRRGTTPESSNNPDGSTAAGSARPSIDAVNPRVNNVYGHIIRWFYARDFSEPTFKWDIFALCGDPADPTHGSTIVGDKYGSPDGLYVAPSGRLWIQTDVSTSTINSGTYAGFGNNQMLCADPGTGETRRFLVGPKQCEITGVFTTPDEKTMFVGIQHPGETPTEAPNDPANPKAFSSWPDGAAGSRPRSSCVVITKDDGGEIGS
ncbi:Tat pathway signal sequence domain protein [Nitrospira sp. KM1]|uniref:PhoX family protein n=1 Tax=Nitrospira sp. KM1 TaxID=1936990 RepID=UPI0013A754DE|nr:PhoX family phosphatase [Nitrospira sp. KM1]BCA54895.1 Tat pathway signal sequence domain protein [Nitrospira sp. KM1]